MGDMVVLQGVGVSQGIVIGPAHLVARCMPDAPHYCVTPEHRLDEEKRLITALDKSRSQLVNIQQDLTKQQNNPELLYILDAHRLILEDTMLRDGTVAYVKKGYNAEWAVVRYLSEIIAVFQQMDDAYLRAKRSDIEQVGKRLLNNLLGHSDEPIAGFPNPVILVAEEFTPSDTLQMKHDTVLGFISQRGGRTSHTAILAKSLDIPAVVGVAKATTIISQGDLLVVDGLNGLLHVNPEPQTLAQLKDKQQRYSFFQQRLLDSTIQPAITTDGHKILLKANIELYSDAFKAKRLGADGIGLYRTEHLYMNRSVLPDEEELVRTFKQVVTSMKDLPITIRTMDVGGEKQTKLFFNSGEYAGVNPAMGMQGIRFCLRKERSVFLSQLRALLRIGSEGDVRILLPMISGVAELEEVLQLLAEAKTGLTRDGLEFNPDVPVGVMVEVPAAALCAKELGAKVDFLSVGTNDLIQFTLAVDRQDESVAYLYESGHPAVLRLISMALAGGKASGVPVSVCGEMAGDPRFAALFMGMGIDELSMTPGCLPLIRRITRAMDFTQQESMASGVLDCQSTTQVMSLLEEMLRSSCGEEHIFH
ncbi:MAG: phosphoenolpyruvate--protein phosphotransferase [Magnetococcales bacterium]|nr:phosphoenolpyruvate--protein phosphotransferase [Magnetococcales bacterium]